MKNYSRVIIAAAVGISLALCVPQLRLQRVTAQSTGLSGSYGFMATAQYTGASNSGPIGLVGTMTFDGSGSLTGSETVVLPDSSPDAIDVKSTKVQFAGTYTVNADGTGTMMLQLRDNLTPVAFVITDGGSSVMFMQTGAGNNLLTGTARKQ